ncbi:hypothetical protein, partial [Salmonella enterica]|uniref:hypothetical protein n=1 Tax=Salmonella enterica TaxID=28901 RepID=UPI0020C21B5A
MTQIVNLTRTSIARIVTSNQTFAGFCGKFGNQSGKPQIKTWPGEKRGGKKKSCENFSPRPKKDNPP